MRIEHYEFGLIEIDGHEERRDLMLSPSGIWSGWWRNEGHVLALEDIEILLAEHPRTLVVGTGAFGRMQPEAGLEQALHERDAKLEAMPTAEAVARINQLLERGESGWAGALHLTC